MPDKTNNKAANSLVLNALSDQGDALTVPREIDHWAYFPTPEGRSVFLESCLNAGFKLRYTTEPNEHSSSFGTVIWHVDTPGRTRWIASSKCLSMSPRAPAASTMVGRPK